MKHLLNNLSEEEKNSIREQHTGGMNVVSENFSKLINARLGDVRNYINEQEERFNFDFNVDSLPELYEKVKDDVAAKSSVNGDKPLYFQGSEGPSLSNGKINFKLELNKLDNHSPGFNRWAILYNKVGDERTTLWNWLRTYEGKKMWSSSEPLNIDGVNYEFHLVGSNF